MYFLVLLVGLLSLDTIAFAADHRHRELAASARAAAKSLAEHQQAPGYWLTAFTGEARLEQPHPELNTFTNVVLIDLLDPVAKQAGVTALLERARAFLGAQIEADGLVRYHGRADAVTRGPVWRCVITPDADDTALVWRVAPGANRELRSKALATLGEFRAANGLYRTWLAPQARYQCIDPGRDPNPTDIGIQMNVLLLLAEADRPAAQALCAALAGQAANDSHWVYYGTKAPLLPLLRLPDLHKAGCPLQLPPSRLQAAVPEQEVWVEAAHLLGRFEGGQATPQDRSRAEDLLGRLAADGFSRARSTPPLLYHNDFTAQVRRFYWSEDVGYALWLRLYFAAGVKRHEP